jgi:hypothetical protein
MAEAHCRGRRRKKARNPKAGQFHRFEQKISRLSRARQDGQGQRRDSFAHGKLRWHPIGRGPQHRELRIGNGEANPVPFGKGVGRKMQRHFDVEEFAGFERFGMGAGVPL